MLKYLGELYCRTFHRRKLTQPVNGKYRCLRCLREFPVPWEEGADAVIEPRRPAVIRRTA